MRKENENIYSIVIFMFNKAIEPHWRVKNAKFEKYFSVVFIK